MQTAARIGLCLPFLKLAVLILLYNRDTHDDCEEGVLCARMAVLNNEIHLGRHLVDWGVGSFHGNYLHASCRYNAFILAENRYAKGSYVESAYFRSGGGGQSTYYFKGNRPSAHTSFSARLHVYYCNDSYHHRHNCDHASPCAICNSLAALNILFYWSGTAHIAIVPS